MSNSNLSFVKEGSAMTSLQLKYFLSVAKYQSFSKAAELCFTSQPSVSRQIALLEKELDLQLFERDKHHVKLTKPGELLYQEFSVIDSHIKNAVSQARQLSLLSNPILNIGYMQEINIDIIRPVIKDFSIAYPQVDINISGYSFREVRENLINGMIDVAYTLSFELTDMPFLSQIPVFHTNAMIVISSSHPAAAKSTCSPEDFQNSGVVITRETSRGASFVLEQCHNYGVFPSEVITSPTSESIIMYLDSRNAFAIMDSSNQFYHDKRFRFIDLPGEKAKISVNAAWHNENSNPAVTLFKDFLANNQKQ